MIRAATPHPRGQTFRHSEESIGSPAPVSPIEVYVTFLRTIAVRWKIMLLAASMTLGIAALSALAITGLSSVSSTADGIAGNVPDSSTSDTIDAAKAEYRGAALQILLAPNDAAVVKDSRGEMADARHEMDESLASWKADGEAPAAAGRGRRAVGVRSRPGPARP